MYIWKATYDCFMGSVEPDKVTKTFNDGNMLLDCIADCKSDIYHYMLNVCLKNTPDNCLFTGFEIVAE